VRILAQPEPAKTRAQAIEDLSAALRAIAEALPLLLSAAEPEPEIGLRGIPGGRRDEFLTTAQALELFGSCSRRTLERFARKHPEIARRVGSRVWYERGALLRVTRRAV
jgi:hypothetical protein